MVGGGGVPHDVQCRVRARRSKISGYSFSRLELTSVLQIALRVSPINNPPSHSSALSDTRQTPTSKSCFSFHLFEAWQPVDPKTHHPHSDIFSSPRVTRPRIWPPGVKGLAILGLTQPSATTSCTSCISNAAEGDGLSIIHIRCRLHPWGSATRSYAHLSPGIRS